MARASRWRRGLAKRAGVGRLGGWWVAALLSLVAVATQPRPAVAEGRSAGAARRSQFACRLARLRPADVQGGPRGVEVELQRVVNPSGQLSTRPHPSGLGHPLTHALITTDFAESQLELITKPHPSNDGVLAQLQVLHGFVARHLEGGELPWADSMPGPLMGRGSLPLAQLGTSYAARLKGLYRAGLVARYGDLMQAISGVHFNYSFPTGRLGAEGRGALQADDRGGFWQTLARLRGAEVADPPFISEQYFGVLRNYRRVAWLTTYLFGASPAIDASFLDGARPPAYLQPGVGDTLLAPFATSLRQSGDLGYGLKGAGAPRVSVNSPRQYLRDLQRALRTPNPAFAPLAGPLTDAQLQQESELYGPARPKHTPAPGQRVMHALANGVEYVELRNLDRNPFLATAIDPASMDFLEALLVASALHESPPLSRREERELAANLQRVACEGRRPGLPLRRAGREVELRAWALALLDELVGVCALLDAGSGEPGAGRYRRALAAQQAKLEDPTLTPSARVIAALSERSFVDHTLELSRAHQAALLGAPLSAERVATLAAAAADSSALERAMREGDAASGRSFEQYVLKYLAQTKTPPAAWLLEARSPAPVRGAHAAPTPALGAAP
ncbi:MAG: glutamate--cysteine ligase [Proteobacteria bacterium]|nr:glutamate--cysteine ligase [Pseudomonadota bacterium]